MLVVDIDWEEAVGLDRLVSTHFVSSRLNVVATSHSQ
jgi:hypothetical protein